MDLIERVKGAVFGGAIGDALGTPVEEMDRETVIKTYGGEVRDFVRSAPGSVCPLLEEGKYSHETQIFLMALEVYAEEGFFNGAKYVEKLVEWVKDERTHRYPAGSHINASLVYAGGGTPEEARVKSVDADGAIPACASGIFWWDNGQDAYEDGSLIASVTHGDELLIDTAGVLAVAVSEVLGERVNFETKEGKLSFVEKLVEYSRTKFLKRTLKTLYDAVRKDISVEEAILKLGNGSFAPEAVSLGVFIALKYSDSFERAVLKSVNSYGDVGGDTDAIGFITGILVGGYRGVSSIPSRWLKKLEGYEHINAIVERLKLS